MFPLAPRKRAPTRRRLKVMTKDERDYREAEYKQYEEDGYFVWRPFGGNCYSYPGDDNIAGVHGNAGAIMGWNGLVSLIIAGLSFSVTETLIVLALAFLDAESGWWETDVPKLPYHKFTGDGVSGVVGWMAGYDFAQLFFKDRRSWLCFGGVSVVGYYTYSWGVAQHEKISHAAHFQTMGAGIMSAIVLRNRVKQRPLRILAQNAGKVTIGLIVLGLLVGQYAKGKYPVVQEGSDDPPPRPRQVTFAQGTFRRTL